jgi:tRNA (guanine-N7-)-methyltransferase
MNRTMQPTTTLGERAAGRRKRKRDPGECGLGAEDLPKPVDPKALFSRDAPLELEIGSGKGTFLVKESKSRPEVNFLGVEYARRYWLAAADRLRRNECRNARIVLVPAETFVREYLGPESLSAVHVYFPDPWPKTRHKRRRLLTAPFVELLASRMKAGARLQIATDHRGYFDAITKAIGRSTLVAAPFGPTAAAADDELVGSNFERKYRVEGRVVFTVAAAKSP